MMLVHLAGVPEKELLQKVGALLPFLLLAAFLWLRLDAHGMACYKRGRAHGYSGA